MIDKVSCQLTQHNLGRGFPPTKQSAQNIDIHHYLHQRRITDIG